MTEHQGEELILRPLHIVPNYQVDVAVLHRRGLFRTWAELGLLTMAVFQPHQFRVQQAFSYGDLKAVQCYSMLFYVYLGHLIILTQF